MGMTSVHFCFFFVFFLQFFGNRFIHFPYDHQTNDDDENGQNQRHGNETTGKHTVLPRSRIGLGVPRSATRRDKDDETHDETREQTKIIPKRTQPRLVRGCFFSG
jgi:hypothetical protein